MLYELVDTNGKKCYVNLMNNYEVARFLLFGMPKLGWTFTGDRPTLRMTSIAKKMVSIKRRIDENKAYQAKLAAMHGEVINTFPDFDDDIPF